jgi:hypothetical protein
VSAVSPWPGGRNLGLGGKSGQNMPILQLSYVIFGRLFQFSDMMVLLLSYCTVRTILALIALALSSFTFHLLAGLGWITDSIPNPVQHLIFLWENKNKKKASNTTLNRGAAGPCHQNCHTVLIPNAILDGRISMVLRATSTVL